MINLVNKLELSYERYQTNENVRDEHYKGKLLFPMKDFFHLEHVFSQCVLYQTYS